MLRGTQTPPKLPSPPSPGALSRGLKDPGCPRVRPRLGHPRPSRWRWHLSGSGASAKGVAAFGRCDPEGCASLPDRPGLRAIPTACATLAPVQHVCATLEPVQCWHPCNAGAHATLALMQHVCATLVPMQHICAMLAPMQRSADATWVPMQRWPPCNTGAHAMLAPIQRRHPCDAGARATLLCHAGTHA